MQPTSAPSRPGSLLLHWVPAALGLVTIAFESTSTMSAEHTSRWLLPAWIWLTGPTTAERWNVVHHIIRKVGHLTGYGALSVTWFYGWNYSLANRQWPRLRVAASALSLAVLCTFLTACADELHQSSLPDRTSSFTDVAIDSLGAFVAQTCTLALLTLNKGRKLPCVNSC